MNPPAAKIFDRIGYVVTTIILIVFAYVFFGCSSKNKTVDRTETLKELATLKDSSGTSSSSSQTKLESAAQSEETEHSESYEFDGAAGDTLSIEKFGPDGKLLSKTRITGKGKAAVSSKKKSSNATESKSEANKQASDSKVQTKSSVRESNKKLAKAKTVKTNGFTFMTYVWIIIVLIIAFILWWLNRRFNIIKGVKNHVTRLFS
jgi:cobalamin biosynthesis Mg chelatase CobN